MIEIVSHQPVGWPFRGGAEIECGRYRRLAIDPCPAYGHSERIVCQELEAVERVVPARHRTVFYLLDFEETSRTNGCSWTDRDYDAPKGPDGEASVVCGTVLSAKRIPPHPAMTRYLVWHEYGHHIETWLQELRHDKLHGNETVSKYMAIRGYDYQPKGAYGGGTWHATPGEIFANDWRVGIGHVEPEYWPHPGIPQVGELSVSVQSALSRWWRQALDDLTAPAPADLEGEQLAA